MLSFIKLCPTKYCILLQYFFVIVSSYICSDKFFCCHSIRVTVMHEHSDDDLVRAAQVIKNAAAEQFK